jgi:SAM-dependent methyltransferase
MDSPLLHQRSDIQPAIEFICTELALPEGARILDLGCGAGRYAVELAHRGYDVVGLDINERYVALAHQLAASEGVRAAFLTGDMREIPFKSHFHAIINVGTSFGFFDSESENHQVVAAVAEALKPGGVFLLEMGNRDYYLKNFEARGWRRQDSGRVVIIQRKFDYVRSRIEVEFEVLGDEEPERWTHSWRAYTLAEMVMMLNETGLALSGVYGGWDLSEYSADSARMVMVSERQRAG